MLNLALVRSVVPFRSIIEDVLAEEIVNRKIPEGALLQFDWDGKSENLTLSIVHEKNPAKS